MSNENNHHHKLKLNSTTPALSFNNKLFHLAPRSRPQVQTTQLFPYRPQTTRLAPDQQRPHHKTTTPIKQKRPTPSAPTNHSTTTKTLATKAHLSSQDQTMDLSHHAPHPHTNQVPKTIITPAQSLTVSRPPQSF